MLVGYSADVEVILAVREKNMNPRAHLGLARRQPRAGRRQGRPARGERRLKPASPTGTEALEGLTAGEHVVTSLERAGVKGGARYTVEEKTSVSGK